MKSLNVLTAGAALAMAAPVSYSSYQSPPKARRPKETRADANSARRARKISRRKI